MRAVFLSLALSIASCTRIAFSTPLFAQETTSGSIGGRVVDSQGLGVPGVTVTAQSRQGSKNAVTDDQGRYFVPYLTSGRYTI
jgi:hypothetical protein